jgi:PAS domain S-box-containing protein
MGPHTASRLDRWPTGAAAKALKAGQLNIGPRLMLGFAVIILSMLAADAAVLWQFHLVRVQAERLNSIDQKLVAVLRLHRSLTSFHDQLEELADSQDVGQLVTEGERLRTAVLEDSRRAMNAFSVAPFDLQRDPTVLPILRAVQSALPDQLEAINTLAASGDWQAVHLRLANQVRPLELLTSELVEKVDHAAGEQQAQTVQNIKRVERLVFIAVPVTAIFTLLIAATLGLAVTRSITQPLARLVEGSKALARGDFQHTVPVTGRDELAELSRVFNDTARRLQDLYATLQRSEDRLRLVIDTIPAHVWSTRPDGSVDFINQRFLEFTGRSVADIPGWDWRSLLHSNDLMRYVGEWQAAIVTGEPMESAARVRRMDGEYRWLLIRNVPLRDERGNIFKWYATSIDIEERQRAEDALRRSEDYLAEAQRLSRTGSFGWKPSTGQLVWSEETFRIFQYERTTTPTVELILQRVHPEDTALVQQTIERAAQEGKDFDVEHRLLMPDGSVKHVHVVARAVNDELGKVEFVGALMDLTAAKRAEKELRQSEEFLLEAQRLSHTGSWRVDVVSGAVSVSPEVYRIHDVQPYEDPSNTEFFFSKFHPEDRERVVELFEKAKVEKTEFEVDYRIVLPDGTSRYLRTTGRPVLNESGKLIEFVGSAMDMTAAKRAEEALRRSENYLAEAQRISHTGSGAWRVPEGDALYLSDEWYRIYGYDPKQGVSAWNDRLSRMHPEDRPKVEEAKDRAIRERSDYEVDHRILLPDGTVKHTHTVGHPVLNASGKVEQFVCTMMDITESKLAEQTLRESEAYLAEAQRLSHTGSWAWAPATGEIRYYSEECYRLTGFDLRGGKPRFETLFERIHPDDQPRVARTIERAKSERVEFELDNRIVHPGGEIRDVHVVGRPVFGASGDVVEFVGTMMDVTERKRGEQATRLLAAVVESSHDAIVSKDLDGIITSWNKAAERLFGYAAEEAIGQNILLIIPPGRGDEERVILERLKRGERIDHFETVRMRKDGSLLDVALTISPMQDAEGRIVGASKLARDVTERKRAEEALRQAQTDLAHINRVTTMGELTASLSHEVNQPIAAAITDANTCLRWLARDRPDLEEARAAASRVVKDAARATEIMSRIRSLFKKEISPRELVDVNDIVRGTIDLLRSEATRHSISMRTELSEDIPQVMGDRVQLQQVTMNLIINSIDAMKGVDGTRELAITSQRADNQQLQVSVSDTGMGLPSKGADQIFDAFFTTKPHGTGMGLRISRSIIESHGGRLWAADNLPRGASFSFTLPIKIDGRE